MSKAQLFALFLCNLVPWTIGNGITSLLPVYAAEPGAARQWRATICPSPFSLWLLAPLAPVGCRTSFSATTWVGGIIGYAGTGYAIQHIGLASTFVIGAFLPLIAIVLLILIRVPKGC